MNEILTALADQAPVLLVVFGGSFLSLKAILAHLAKTEEAHNETLDRICRRSDQVISRNTEALDRNSQALGQASR